MRAERVDDPNTSIGIAKGNEVFTQDARAHRGAVGFRQFLGEQRRQPVAAE